MGNICCRAPSAMPPTSIPASTRAWRAFLAGVAIGLALLFVIGVAVAQTPDTGGFDRLLRAHVKNGVVDYGAFAASPEFRRYVDDLAKPTQLRGREETLAYY